jgi:hypothetical protein
VSDLVTRRRTVLGLQHWLGWGFAFAVSSVFTIDVPLALSRSGSLAVTVGDFFGAALWAILAWLVVTKRWRPGSTYRALLLAVVVFCAWFAVVTLIRLLSNEEVLQAFLIARTTLLPVAGFLIIGAKLEPPQRALNGLVVFELLLTLWHLHEWNNMRMSLFLGNSIVYAGLIVMLLPLNAYVASRERSEVPTLLRWMALVNMLAALVFPVWAGSRGTSLVAFVIILLTFLVMAFRRRFVVTMLAIGACALVIQASVWYVNPQGAAYGIYRLVPPPIELGITPPHAGQAGSDLAQRETALVEKGKSDAGRAELIDESTAHIRKDPLIGDGVVYFELPDDGVEQEYAAHNFVLEHINAYGGIGFILYLLLFGIPLWPAIRWLRRRDSQRDGPLLALLTTAGLLTFSLTQPTTLLMVMMVPYYLAVGGLIAPLVKDRREEAHDCPGPPS